MDTGFNAGMASEPGQQQQFKFPKWKKIVGEEHSVSVWDLQYDLLATEEYMNNMLALGWKPVSIRSGTLLTFIPCEPGAFICRTVITVNSFGMFDKRKAAELGDLLVADGAEIIPQFKTMGSQIGLLAVRPALLGPFQIASDLDSQIAEYQARLRFSEGFGASFLVIGIMQVVSFGFMDGMIAGVGISIIWFILAMSYFQPVPRYKKILARLRSLREVSEA